MKSFLAFIMMCLTLISCSTFSVSMAHTAGTADDVIDDTQSNTPTVSPTIAIPLK